MNSLNQANTVISLNFYYLLYRLDILPAKILKKNNKQL